MLWDGIGLEEDSRMDVMPHVQVPPLLYPGFLDFARVLAPRLRARVGLLNHIANLPPRMVSES